MGAEFCSRQLGLVNTGSLLSAGVCLHSSARRKAFLILFALLGNNEVVKKRVCSFGFELPLKMSLFMSVAESSYPDSSWVTFSGLRYFSVLIMLVVTCCDLIGVVYSVDFDCIPVEEV